VHTPAQVSLESVPPALHCRIVVLDVQTPTGVGPGTKPRVIQYQHAGSTQAAQGSLVSVPGVITQYEDVPSLEYPAQLWGGPQVPSCSHC
jgi:hypothetical protein